MNYGEWFRRGASKSFERLPEKGKQVFILARHHRCALSRTPFTSSPASNRLTRRCLQVGGCQAGGDQEGKESAAREWAPQEEQNHLLKTNWFKAVSLRGLVFFVTSVSLSVTSMWFSLFFLHLKKTFYLKLCVQEDWWVSTSYPEKLPRFTENLKMTQEILTQDA